MIATRIRSRLQRRFFLCRTIREEAFAWLSGSSSTVACCCFKFCLTDLCVWLMILIYIFFYLVLGERNWDPFLALDIAVAELGSANRIDVEAAAIV